MKISASMVKELRERSGAGMMECKKALEETNGDIEAAIDALRARGEAKAAKRAGKIAAEGTIAIQVVDLRHIACIVEVNCETDFVSRSDSFLEFSQSITTQGLQHNVQDVNVLLQLPIREANPKNVDQARQDLIAQIGENVQIRRMRTLHSEGVVGSYLHGARIGVLVAINKHVPELARDIAMHIAAANPKAIEASQVPADFLSREREIFIAQSKESGKPDNIIEKMVAGRVAKFLKEICLVDQLFVKDTEKTVGELLKMHNAQVTDFVRFEVGEGIEKITQDFAEEVKAQLKGNQ